MPRVVSDLEAAAFTPLAEEERRIGQRIPVRVRAEGSQPFLEAWCWNERLTESIGGDDAGTAATRLAKRVRRAFDSGLMRGTLDVLEYVERERRFGTAGWTHDALRFAYRQTRAEAAARLLLAGRRGLLFLDDASEELCVLFHAGGRLALVRESRLRLEDFDRRAVESVEVELLDLRGAPVGTRTFAVPVCPPLPRLEVGLQELLVRDLSFAVGRSPETGLPFAALRTPEGLEVHEYVQHSDQVDLDLIEGFPPAEEGSGGSSARWQDALMCPRCRADLPWSDTVISCRCGSSYPVHEGRPDFLCSDPRHPTPHPGEVWAPNPKQKVLLYFLKKYARGVVLDCGSGNSAFRAPNLVNLEVFPFGGVNVVADGQRLPFRDGSVDAVVSAAVLEHVPNPFAYCSELWRVLKPGGEVRIDSAFLQPYHACPDHYFGTTRSGLIRAAERFEPVGVGVAPGQSPFVALQTWLHAYQSLLTQEQLRRFRAMTIEEIMSIPNGMAPSGIAVPGVVSHRVAAGVYFHGVKG